MATNEPLPQRGTIFLSINRRSKDELLSEMWLLHEHGFNLVATEGTAQFLVDKGIPCEIVFKISEGRPNILDLVKSNGVDLIINTPTGKVPRFDAYTIRQAAVRYNIPIITTISAAKAAVRGLLEVKEKNDISVKSIQEYHKEVH